MAIQYLQIGLEEDEEAIEGFEPTLTYAKAEFTVEPIIEPEEEYLAYIGTWYDEKGNEYTLTQDVVNASYIMTGLDADIPVLYENKGIKFSGEEKLGSTTEGYSIYLFGLDQEGYAEDASQNDDDPYILATGAMEDNKIAIAGSEYEAIYDGDSYDEVIVGLIVYGVDESNNKLYRLAETPAVLSLPASLSKDKPGVEDVYSKFIGSWTITRGEATDTWIISAKEEGKSFNIDGVEGFSGEESITIEGKFEDDKLVVYAQTLNSWTHKSYGTVENHLMGNVVVDENKYRINGDYALFAGTLSADGKTIEMTPGTVTVESLGGELTLAGLQFYGVLTDEGPNKGAALYYNADYTTLPNTLTASTESPSSVSVSKQAVAIMGTPALNSSTTIRTFSFAGDKTKGNLEKYATDGDGTTRWCACSSHFPEWLQFDMGENRTFSTVTIDFEGDYKKYAYELQASLDGNVWTHVFAKEKGGEGRPVFEKPITARHLRALVTDANNGWASIREICAYEARLDVPPYSSYYNVCGKYRLRWFDVPYEPGELRAVAYRGGKRIGETVMRTAGDPAALKLTVEPKLADDPGALAWVQVDVVDARGVRNPLAMNRVNFRLDGPGKILGVGNGNPHEFEAFTKTASHPLFFGKAMAVVRRDGPGELTLTVSSEGLTPARAAIW